MCVCVSQSVTNALFCCSAPLPTAGGMLETNVANISMTAKPREVELRSVAAPSQDMASRKPAKTLVLPGGPPRSSTGASELRVYRPPAGSVPSPSGLRKQKSLNNLSVLTDAEKKLHLYQSTPQWSDDAGRPGTNTPGQNRMGQTGKPLLCRTLSKSEQSLFQGKPKCSTSNVIPNSGKPSRIPGPGKSRGPYAEVKPLSKATEVGRTSEHSNPPATKVDLTGAVKSGSDGKNVGEKGRVVTPREGEVEVQDKSFLKVDPHLVVTVLGDLEQLLFSQMLGESLTCSSFFFLVKYDFCTSYHHSDRWQDTTYFMNTQPGYSSIHKICVAGELVKVN